MLLEMKRFRGRHGERHDGWFEGGCWLLGATRSLDGTILLRTRTIQGDVAQDRKPGRDLRLAARRARLRIATASSGTITP
jgi:hypothetical protein